LTLFDPTLADAVDSVIHSAATSTTIAITIAITITNSSSCWR
jgi:hypothetical protein